MCPVLRVNMVPTKYILVQKFFLNETAHNKIYNETCATSEDLDQSAHPQGLIRVFADHMCSCTASRLSKDR